MPTTQDGCHVHYITMQDYVRIYVRTESMPKLRAIVGPHMIPFSMYKLTGGRRPII
jgi:hypothetical protein